MPSRDIRECAACRAILVDQVTLVPSQESLHDVNAPMVCGYRKHDWHSMRLVPRDTDESEKNFHG